MLQSYGFLKNGTKKNPLGHTNKIIFCFSSYREKFVKYTQGAVDFDIKFDIWYCSQLYPLRYFSISKADMSL
jgi:hypothetical protein